MLDIGEPPTPDEICGTTAGDLRRACPRHEDSHALGTQLNWRREAVSCGAFRYSLWTGVTGRFLGCAEWNSTLLLSSQNANEFRRCQALHQWFASVAIFPKPRSRSSAVTRVELSVPEVAAKKRSAGS